MYNFSMFHVCISNKTKYHFIYQEIFLQILKYVGKIHRLNKPTLVNVIIVGNKKMQTLNYQYRHKNKPTDILSFSYDYQNLAKIIKQNILGDIYISYQKILLQANKYHHSVMREWCYLFAHGLLHLLGYDHQTKNDEKKMNDLSEKIMSRIKVGRW